MGAGMLKNQMVDSLDSTDSKPFGGHNSGRNGVQMEKLEDPIIIDNLEA